MTNELCIGDNFAVRAEEGNPEGAQYYILQCQRTKSSSPAPSHACGIMSSLVVTTQWKAYITNDGGERGLIPTYT
jgi:hypothetical protein